MQGSPGTHPPTALIEQVDVMSQQVVVNPFALAHPAAISFRNVLHRTLSTDSADQNIRSLRQMMQCLFWPQQTTMQLLVRSEPHLHEFGRI